MLARARLFARGHKYHTLKRERGCRVVTTQPVTPRSRSGTHELTLPKFIKKVPNSGRGLGFTMAETSRKKNTKN